MGGVAHLMDAQTSILLAVKGLAAISEAALDVALGVINGNEGVVDVALAVGPSTLLNSTFKTCMT